MQPYTGQIGQRAWRSRQGVPDTMPRSLLRAQALRMYRKRRVSFWPSTQLDQRD